jgi:hypothetical protein
MEIFQCKEIQAEAQLKRERRTIAAITAAVNAYMEEERELRSRGPRRQPAMVSNLWNGQWNEEIMRVLWQRGIVPRVMIFGFYPDVKLRQG